MDNKKEYLNNKLLFKQYYICYNNEIYDLKLEINNDYINFFLKLVNNELDLIYTSKIEIIEFINRLKLKINYNSNLVLLLDKFDYMYNNNKIKINKNNNIISITFTYLESIGGNKYEIIFNKSNMNIDDKINYLFNAIKYLQHNNIGKKNLNDSINNLNFKINKNEDDIKNIINEKDIIIDEIKDKIIKQAKENKNEIQTINKKIEKIFEEQKIISNNINNVIKELNLFKENVITKIKNDIKNLQNENEKINKKLNDLALNDKDLFANSNLIKTKVDKILQNGANLNSICQKEDFNSLSLNELKEQYLNSPNYKLLESFKNAQMELINEFRLIDKYLDSRGNKIYNWGTNKKRGLHDYDPPLGWNWIGLKVINRYMDNVWIGKSNQEGEWAVSYYGFYGEELKHIKMMIPQILNAGFKMRYRQHHKNCEDINHPGKKIGEGVYFIHSFKSAELYAGTVEINHKKYKILLMVRIKPSAIRHCNCQYNNYWVVNGTFDEVRPYRILFKESD